MKKIVLLAGGSGLIGTRLKELLLEAGYTVRVLTRNPRATDEFSWNPASGKIDDSSLESVDFVINLAGAGIADKRWTPARKRAIVDSRVQAARVLAQAFIRTGHKPQAYISASAIGFYGNSGDRVMTETDAPVDSSFMVDCCRQWELAADTIATLGIRTVKFRIGVVLAKEGGALAEVIKPLHWGLGAYFGDGLAWWSWIHRDDVCRMMIWAMEHPKIDGVWNAVAPHPERGKTLVVEASNAMRQRAIVLPAPGIALHLILGEMSAVILNSNNVSAQKIEQAGFQFQYPRLPQALTAIFQP